MFVLPPQKHGLVIIPDGTPNGDVNHEPQSSGITVVSQEAAQVLESAGEGPLGESRISFCPWEQTFWLNTNKVFTWMLNKLIQ